MKIKFTNIGKENIQIAKTVTESYINGYLDATQEFISESKAIVSELITNAVIHAEPTFIELELYHSPTRLFITVEDNGLGIIDIEKAKEPLYTTKTNEERAGLGFTIVDVFSDTFEIESDSGTMVKVSKKVK